MKLATLKQGNRDGILIVVDSQLKRAIKVPDIAKTLLTALESWDYCEYNLQQVYEDLNKRRTNNSFTLDFNALASPLPRCYQWLDGSAYLSHVRRVRKARNADMPESFLTDPLMYQGASDSFLGPHEDIPLADDDWGCDLEAELAIITDDVPMGTKAADAEQHIRLLMLANDVSLRNLIPGELAKGFGFMQGKPSTSFSPVAVTPDELGEAWSQGKLHLPLSSYVNDNLLGQANAGTDMQFNFHQLIEHAAKTRKLSAGTIIGSGTVSNEDESVGDSCLVEKRVKEIIAQGETSTPFLTFDDHVRIEMFDKHGNTIFGAIDQDVIECQT